MKNTKVIFLLVALVGFSLSVFARQKGKKSKVSISQTSTIPPTPNGPSVRPESPNNEPKPYNEVITAKAKSQKGLFTVHQIEEKIYFEIPDSVLNREILIVSRLAKAGADMRSGNAPEGYAGDELNKTVVKFEKGVNNKIFVREMSYSERSKDSTQAIFRSLMRSNIQPIILAFDVKAYHRDSLTKSENPVIEMTDLINGDNDLLFFGNTKFQFGIGGYEQDKSYLLGIKSYPINTEIKTIKTYGKNRETQTLSNAGVVGNVRRDGAKSVTVELNTSILLLPKTPMIPRYADGRVGYFESSYTDFDANPQGVKQVSFIDRWRLEPKKEDMEKYKRGELVEPAKPIVIYIDPETPAKLVPYLIQGINDWQVAFERAGFKNAIIGKKAPSPEEDPSWSIDDARNSALVYKPSAVSNASGPHITDPRSGEIIETHINWYHNIMELLHDWYLIQAGAIDPKARKMQFDDELMGQLIRFTSSHEVGHTLGLLHNFGASSFTPVEKLRDKAWVEANGHTPSIMDYARFNYVAQPEDGISEKGIFPRIGEYDKWAIEWGYRLIPNVKSAEDEIPTLNKWIVTQAKDRRHWFGSEKNQNDPQSQSEDLGDNAMKAGTYGIKNLKRVISELPNWTRQENEAYQELFKMYQQVFLQFSRYIDHVIKNIGGKYENLKSVEQPGPVYTYVPAAKQREAINFLKEQVFKTPTWLLDKKILGYTGISPLEIIGGMQETVLVKLLNIDLMTKLIEAEAVDPSAYTLTQYLTDLENGVWTELSSSGKIELYRRNLQKLYIERLLAIANPSSSVTIGKTTDVQSIAKARANYLNSKIKNQIPLAKDELTRNHLKDISDRITKGLK